MPPSRNNSTSSLRSDRTSSSSTSSLPPVEEKFGFEAHFDPVLDKKYVCPVCLCGLREPVQTKCGHRFCRACILKATGTQSIAKCPIDKIIFNLKTELFGDLAVKREVLSHTVLCLNKDRGCSWKAELRSLEEHAEQCEFTLVKCNNGCGEEFILQDEPLHEDECPLRVVTCSYCKESVVHRDLTQHFQACPRYPVSCSQCGKTELLREELCIRCAESLSLTIYNQDLEKHIDHYDGDCPEVVVPCSFEEMGCRDEIKRKLMSIHLQEATNQHFQLMNSYTCDLKRLLRNQETMLRETQDTCNQLICEQADLARQLVEKNTLLSRQADRLKEISTTSATGLLHWKVSLPSQNYTSPLLSPPFYTSRPGYKFRLCLELRGHVARSETYASLFVMLCRGEFDDQLFFPFNGVCHVTVFNQSNSRPSSSDQQHLVTTIECQNMSRAETDNCQNQKRGRLRFIKTESLTKGKYCHNRELFLKAEIVLDDTRS